MPVNFIFSRSAFLDKILTNLNQIPFDFYSVQETRVLLLPFPFWFLFLQIDHSEEILVKFHYLVNQNTREETTVLPMASCMNVSSLAKDSPEPKKPRKSLKSRSLRSDLLFPVARIQVKLYNNW